jgi:SAM-dependent methyltransferase
MPVELIEKDSPETRARRPWEVVESIIESGADWRSNSMVRNELHPVCFKHYERYGLGDLIVETFQDPLKLSSEGDITTTRDYATYRGAFEEGAHRKVADFADEVHPGRILDIGCATGQTIKLLSEKPQLFESDFYGVEAARPLYEICEQRKSNGEFGTANVFFYQRNIMRSSLFPRNSLDTVITMALTHEINSYLGQQALLDFVKRVYDMTAPGGIYINYDVVAPTGKDRPVYAIFTDNDGANPDDLFPSLEGNDLADFLKSLSSKARFWRFVHDFRREEGDQIKVSNEVVNGVEYVMLRYADLADFLAKRDYTDSWLSEMHERFCFWEFADWKKVLNDTGFNLTDTSRTVQNQWLIENRFKPAAKVFVKDKSDNLMPLEPPETNVLLFAIKPV